ncbi:TPA: hypothetical protein ACXF9K_001459 [Enterobacter cloacae]
MKNLKNFTLYTPLNARLGVMYLKSADGVDWYACQSEFSADTTKIVYTDDGKIISIARDISLLFPIDASVAEVDDVPAGMDISGEWIFDGNAISKVSVG